MRSSRKKKQSTSAVSDDGTNDSKAWEANLLDAIHNMLAYLVSETASRGQVDTPHHLVDCLFSALNDPTRSVHLAMFVEPYLGYILAGKKTVESRFSANRCAPYQQVRPDDIVILKRAGGPVTGICLVSHVWFYQLDLDSWREIRQCFTQALCAQDPEFWRSRNHASFATLMQIEQVLRISPVPCLKRDRRGWVILRSGDEQLSLRLSDGIGSHK